MTTAHRPTWKAAVGQANEGGWGAGGSVSHQASALDMPGHTKLKVRHSQAVQDSVEALQAAEQAAQSSRKELLLAHRPMDPENEKRAKLKLLQQTNDIDVAKLKAKYDDSDIDDGGSSESDLDDDDDSDLDDDISDDDDSGDEEAALQAELAKIRAEREEAKRKAAEEEENEKEEAAAVTGNPLLHVASASSGRSMKRRWNEDVVFRNQAKSEVQQPKKRFINDTVRNDFHKRFLNKFIR